MKESEKKMSENRNHNTVRLAKMGMLVAVSIVLVYFSTFPDISGSSVPGI